MNDVLIKNGTVFDGTGGPGRKADLVINKGRIDEIKPGLASRKAETIVDAQGKYVLPGFIDIQNHSDSYWTLFDEPSQTSLVSQGITSIVIGNCGSSLAPLSNAESLKTVQKWHDLSGVNINWSSFAELMATLQGRGLSLNTGSLVGHATLRRGLIGDAIRDVSDEEISIMVKLLEKALEEGAMGLSLGLVYAHEVDSSKKELVRLAEVLAHSDKYLSVHLRSEGSHILESLDEAIELARTAQVRLKISHLKIRGKKNWHLAAGVLNRLENAYHQGMDVSFDVYPYDSSWSVLYTYLPKWAYEGGRSEIMKKIASPLDKRKILDYLKSQEYEHSNIVVAQAMGNSGLVGKSISQIAANQLVAPEEALLNIIQAANAQVEVFDHNLSPEHVRDFLMSPLSMVATDGAGFDQRSQSLVHPRCFGAMPKFLRRTLDEKILKFEDAVKKITSEPARVAGIKDRGVLIEGKAADVVVLDPLTLSDQADYVHPYKMSSGIDLIFNNGKLSFASGEVTGMNGVLINK